MTMVDLWVAAVAVCLVALVLLGGWALMDAVAARSRRWWARREALAVWEERGRVGSWEQIEAALLRDEPLPGWWRRDR